MSGEWRPVADYEGIYEVSDRGQVRSRVRPGRRCSLIMKPYLRGKGSGHPCVWLSKNGQREQRFVHRLVLEAFVGPCPEGKESRHGPGGHLDNRWPENLSYGTKTENQRDRLRDGTDGRGEKNGCAKLTEAQVVQILVRQAAGESQRALAFEFGVDPSTVGLIVRRKNWRHVEFPVAA